METHRAFAEAATWLANLHRDVTAGLVGDEVHDMLDRTPDRTELEATADACERATEALAQALRTLSDAMKLRADRFAPGEALEERAYGDLDAWLQSAHDSVPSIHDVVRFNQLEKRAAEAGIAEVTEAAASRPGCGAPPHRTLRARMLRRLAGLGLSRTDRCWPNSMVRPTVESSSGSASWTGRSFARTRSGSPRSTGSGSRATRAAASWAF